MGSMKTAAYIIMFSRHSGFFHRDFVAKMWFSVLLVLVQSRKVQLLLSTITQPLWWALTINQLVSALFSHCTIFIPFLFQVYLPFLRIHCEIYPQRNLRLSADIMLIYNMLAGSCAAGRSPLPAVCLHFSLFNVGSPVCEAQLHGLNVNQSIHCERECSNKCRLVIFLG